jgi:FeS assembly protein IscX
MLEKNNKTLHWIDTREIVFELIDAHPNIDPINIRFTDLHAWVCALPNFKDDPKRSNEKILEAIQMLWIEEL